MIHSLKPQGLSVSEIAQDRKTVHKYLRQNVYKFSAIQRKPPKSENSLPTKRICKRGCSSSHNCPPRGYCGGYSMLTDYLRTVRPLPEVDLKCDSKPRLAIRLLRFTEITCCATYFQGMG